MPRPDLAKLFADNLGAIPTPDGHEIRLFEYRSFGQAEDVKKRVEARAAEVGAGLVLLAEQHGYVISHPSDPVEVEPSGRRVGNLHCSACGQKAGQISVDDGDKVIAHPDQLAALGGEHHCG